MSNSFSCSSFQITSCLFRGSFSLILQSPFWVPPGFVPLLLKFLTCVFFISPLVFQPSLWHLLFLCLTIFFLTAVHLATEQYRAAGCQDKPDPRRPRRAAPSSAQTQTPVSTQGWGEKNGNLHYWHHLKTGSGQGVAWEDSEASGQELESNPMGQLLCTVTDQRQQGIRQALSSQSGESLHRPP